MARFYERQVEREKDKYIKPISTPSRGVRAPIKRPSIPKPPQSLKDAAAKRNTPSSNNDRNDRNDSNDNPPPRKKNATGISQTGETLPTTSNLPLLTVP